MIEPGNNQEQGQPHHSKYLAVSIDLAGRARCLMLDLAELNAKFNELIGMAREHLVNHR